MQYKYQSFIIEKIGKRYYISPEWLRMNDEICTETKTLWGAKKMGAQAWDKMVRRTLVGSLL